MPPKPKRRRLECILCQKTYDSDYRRSHNEKHHPERVKKHQHIPFKDVGAPNNTFHQVCQVLDSDQPIIIMLCCEYQSAQLLLLKYDLQQFIFFLRVQFQPSFLCCLVIPIGNLIFFCSCLYRINILQCQKQGLFHQFGTEFSKQCNFLSPNKHISKGF